MTSAPHSATRIVAPVPPSPPGRQTFPLVATTAPVLLSIVLWLVTRSPYALVFAALGPVVAVATMIDARLGGRRRRRMESSRFEAELEAARVEIAESHAVELRGLELGSPSAHALTHGPEHERWAAAAPTAVRLGSADRPSMVTLDGGSDQRGEDPNLAALRTLRSDAVVLREAPFTVEIGSGVGVAGGAVEARALARAVLLQVLAFRSPATHSVRGGEDWLECGPHDWHPGSPELVEVAGEEATVTIAIAREPSALPRQLGSVVRVDGGSARLVGTALRFAPELVSAEEAMTWADRASRVADRNGATPRAALLPQAIGFSELSPVGAGSGLAAVIGAAATGPAIVDLVSSGPHAVVGGTTGSGKSELLVTWLLSIASSGSPDEVNFLLFDFKGGSSFGALPTLPHCVGVLTDLDPGGAARAIASLSAELRHRERQLAAASARSVDELRIARLLIVVDEFAAMAADFPELHGLFGDIAARGRSLGVHLVLCTQRPGGVVRDAVLSNASLRISLRVNNRGDSIALLGSDAAAAPLCPSGRAWIARAGFDPEPVQVAISSAEDIARVAAAWGAGWTPRRPWLDPLPRLLAPSHAALSAGALGLVDRPDEQAQLPLEWQPDRDGSLLVIGGARSGKSNVLDLLDPLRPQLDVESAWDAARSPGGLLLIDDLDLLIARYPAEYQQAFVELVVAALRAGTPAVLSVQRLTASVQNVAALCDSRVLLRMPSKQEHVIAGGSAETFDPELPPGGGCWRGERVQFALGPGTDARIPTEPATLVVSGPMLAVSTRPRALSERLGAKGMERAAQPGEHGAFVIDPDGWLAASVRLAPLLRELPLLLHECSALEYRQVTRRRELPPPIANAATTAWLLEPEGEPQRVRL